MKFSEEMIYSRQLGKMIKEAREIKELELGKLAELLNVSRVYMHDIELGNRLPSVEELTKLSEILGIDVDVEFHANELTKVSASVYRSKILGVTVEVEFNTNELPQIPMSPVDISWEDELEAFLKRLEELNT